MNFFNAINKYRFSRWCYLHHLKPIAWLLRGVIYITHSSYIPYTAEIGMGTTFAYKGIGVVVHAKTKIGENCMIGTNVTIGGGARGEKHRIPEFDKIRSVVPVIGDRVDICTGAKVIGPIVIGNDAIIGANAVVINDVPAGAVVGGVPAKILYIKK